jgi:hypothetical protein
MQSPYSIPPYTETGLEKLIGLWASFPRESNPQKCWWGQISEVKFITAHSALVKIESHHMAGRPKWHPLPKVRFANHRDDPLVVALHRARAKEL